MNEAWPIDRVLQDLQRWQFGALLASRARWGCTDAPTIDAAVQAYRLRILAACLKHAGRPETVTAALPEGEAAVWEAVLVREFLAELTALASLGEAEPALTRFAHGQYFKYSRRVAMLMQLQVMLPCAYGVNAQPVSDL